MLGDLSRVSKIYLVTGRTDMRKSIDGLMSVIRDTYDMDPSQMRSSSSVGGSRTGSRPSILTRPGS